MDYAHAKERFKRRYGREIEDAQIHALEELGRQNKVVSRHATLVEGRDRIIIRVGDENIDCIVVRETGMIITFIQTTEVKHQRRKKKFVQNGNRRGRKAANWRR